MSTEEPNIHPSVETPDTTVLGDTIKYLDSLHSRFDDHVFEVKGRDEELTASLPKRLKALQKVLADTNWQAAQENARD